MMRFLSFLVTLSLLAFSVGCPSNSSQSQPDVDTVEGLVEPSGVPLRIGIVTDDIDQQLFERQWLSESDQPIEVTKWSTTEFLQLEECELDVVLYPARMMGELLQRQWISQLPNGLRIANRMAGLDDTDASTSAVSFPEAWLSQSRFGRQSMAVPLGCQIPSVIVSDVGFERLPVEADEERPVDWDQIFAAFDLASREMDEPSEMSEDAFDHDALVDRFLFLAASHSEKNLKYGLLFDTKTMQAELHRPEFVRAAEILRRLARQPQGLEPILGSHSAAWRWIATRERPAVAIAAASSIDAQATEVTAGRPLHVTGSTYWNTGGGMVASLARRCRQTAQATLFLRWLGSPETRDALQPLLPGVAGNPQSFPVDSLRARVHDSLAAHLPAQRLGVEPRIAGAHDYRRLLGEQLRAIIVGEQSIDGGLTQAAAEWNERFGGAAESLATDYKRGLELIE